MGLKTVMDGDLSGGLSKAKRAKPTASKVTWNDTNTGEITQCWTHKTLYRNTLMLHIHEEKTHTHIQKST